jgi:hypothetical protein
MYYEHESEKDKKRNDRDYAHALVALFVTLITLIIIGIWTR